MKTENTTPAPGTNLAGTVPAPEAEPAESNAVPRSRRRGKRALGGLLVGVLLAGGTAFGTTLPDPTTSEAYRSVADAKAGAESERDSLRSDYDSLKSDYVTLQAGIADKEAKVQARETEVGKAESAVKSAEAAVKKREEAVTAAEKQKAANTVSDGTWTVGKDVAAGTYRATADVGSSCYWGIYETGSNGGNIIENDLPGGGRPSVALSAGQDFKSSRCGTWTKQ
ncbi:coiled-coil domain-containing protein [Arthrobacter sp. AD-310]